MAKMGLLACCLMLCISAHADWDVGLERGGYDCSAVTKVIIDEWFTMKDFFAAGQKKNMRRPRERSFQCVSPFYSNEWIPKSTAQHLLSCFVDAESKDPICCNKRGTSCATLRKKNSR